MRWKWAVGAAVAVCLVLGGVVGATARTPLDFNISVNSGAEGGQGGRGQVVPIPLWKTTSMMTAVRYGSPGFPSKAFARAVNGEANFFYCGRTTAGSTARQRIGIYGRDRLIDRGGLALDLRVRIAVPTNDGDAGRMVVRFLDGGGRTIGTLGTATVTATGGQMPRIKASGPIPARTRALQVILRGTGTAGTSCDVYFDNVSVHLVRAAS
jgi:hypothetical protein